MNSHRTTTAELQPDPTPRRSGRLSRALTTAACLTLLVGVGAACSSSGKAVAERTPVTTRPATTTTVATTPEVTTTAVPAIESPPTTEAIEDPVTIPVVVVEDACRPETAPIGTDDYGVTHTGEKICTWGPGVVAHLDGNGFVIPSQNHPIDLAMAQECWSADGRVYLRTPAVEGWACI